VEFLDFVGIPIPEGVVYPLAWLVALIFAIIIVSKNRGKAEKFLLIVCIIMLVLQFGLPFIYEIIYLMTGTSLFYSYFHPVLNSLGIILVIIAFWIKYRAKDM